MDVVNVYNNRDKKLYVSILNIKGVMTIMTSTALASYKNNPTTLCICLVSNGDHVGESYIIVMCGCFPYFIGVHVYGACCGCVGGLCPNFVNAF